MAQSLIQQASDLFRQARFLEAYDAYATAGQIIGMEQVAANMRICLQRNSPMAQGLPLCDLRVACIMDDFSWQSYSPECIAIQLLPSCWLSAMERFQPHFLFVESAWRGKNELWRGKVMPVSRELSQLVDWCKNHFIPTVFWNKEDPVHYEKFLETASLFDFVFTTDISRIAHYKHKFKHERVFYLPFANQPRYFNPLNKMERRNSACFAGSWYPNYTERCRNFRSIVAGLDCKYPLAIYDRNMERGLDLFRFPDEFQHCIQGTLPPNQINLAYKGYRIGVTLNTVKQSQTMYARRALELLACNTTVVSNFSAGIRTALGDLVISTDDSGEIGRRLDEIDNETDKKLRLAGLRRVMSQSCYEDTLARIANKVLGYQRHENLPSLVIIGFAKDSEQVRKIINIFASQNVSRKRLLIFMAEEVIEKSQLLTDVTFRIINLNDNLEKPLSLFCKPSEWVGCINPQDWYGDNCFLDLLLASRYWQGDSIGKAEHYRWHDDCLQLNNVGVTYEECSLLSLSCMIRKCKALTETVKQILHDLEHPKNLWNGLAIDSSNYCVNGAYAPYEAMKPAADLCIANQGVSLEAIYEHADAIKADAELLVSVAKWDSKKIFQMCCKNSSQVSFMLKGDSIQVKSTLPKDAHRYFFKRNLVVKSVPFSDGDISYLKTQPGCDIKYTFVYRDKDKNEISHQFLASNVNNRMELPANAEFIDFALRVADPGTAQIHTLEFGYTRARHPQHMAGTNVLLITTFYPDYDNLYKNAFIHTRVLAYKKAGIDCEVFCLQPGVRYRRREFQGISIVIGQNRDLDSLLATGRYKVALIHLLNRRMWTALDKWPNLPKIVWIHGIEIQPWQRRGFNYRTQEELDLAVHKSDGRMELWREILGRPRANLHLVFVSQHFMCTAMEDVGLCLPSFMYSVIHNYIDGSKFAYVPKTAEMRKKILVLRSFASQKYGNDLAAQAICRLARKPFFNDLFFHIAGDGELFEEVTSSLRQFTNVKLERRFFPQTEIPAVHAQYGIFLCPSRMDAQGVSRDEAMSSGLVPVTNAVEAIPEFTDDTCAILAGPESAVDLAEGIERLYKDPALFLRMSEAAAARPRRQSGWEQTIGREIALIRERICRL